MNGELQQLCMLVNGARNAVTGKREFVFSQEEYVNSIEFNFLPRKTLFGTKPYCAEDPNAWFSQCIDRGVRDVKFLVPLKAGNRRLLGFSNTNAGCIVTFYKNGRVTYWTASWEFDRTIKMWNVKYQEQIWEKVPQEPLRLDDNFSALEGILFRISEFADLIGFQGFGDVFRNAHSVLTGKSEISENYPNGKRRWLPDVPEKKKRMFYAASEADVFGAMGSWNDSPPWYAHERGLDKEYEDLSDELLKQIRLAAMYAVNED